MRYWWVNQNQTYKYEVPGGFMWSPFKNTNGARNVLRQDDCWVDLPPRVLVKAFAKAFVKEAISPIIY